MAITTLNLEQSEYVFDAADMAGIDTDEDLVRDYSGRFMFGETCFGIIGDQQSYGQFMIELAAGDADLARELSNAVKTDSMALSTIYYFPGYRMAD